DIAHDEAQTFRAWWQWNRDDETAINLAGYSTERMESGICFVVGKTNSWLSELLQNGFGQHRKENLHRSGWKLSLCEEGAGRKENCKAGFSRVDRVEVLEQGHPELEQWRDAEGIVYFYDLKAARHPSYSVNGFLVHNSSILKNF